MATAEDLKQRFVPYFTEPWASKGFENVTLVSQDNKHISINSCVFSSVNPLCHQMLKSTQSEDGNFHVITELSFDDLVRFKSLATTGNVVCSRTLDQSLRDETIHHLTFGYGSLGLSNQKSVKASLTEVKDFQGFPKTSDFSPKSHNNATVKNMTETTKACIKRKARFRAKVGCIKKRVLDQSEKMVEEDESWDEDQLFLPLVKHQDSDSDEWDPSEVLVSPDQDLERLFYFPQEYSSESDKAKQQGKNFKCHLCVRGFQTERTYQQHLRRHSAKSHADAYFCLTCPGYVAFTSRAALQEHRAECHTHTERREVRCPYCPKVNFSTHLSTFRAG